MRLGINGWRIHGQRTGVGRYVLNIVRHWTPELAGARFRELNFYTPRPLDRADLRLPPSLRERVLGPDMSMLLWENLRLGPFTNDDVLYCPSYSRPLLSRGRTVVVTHEAILRMYPKLFPRRARFVHDRLYAWSARHADLVITSTEAARQDIARAYAVPPERIRVIPMAPDAIFRPLPRAEFAATPARYIGSDDPFFLFVGKLSGRRDIPVLLEAFAAARRAGRLPHKLLLVGLNIHNLAIHARIAELGLAEHVRHVEWVSDEELARLYNAAHALVMPSVYETVSLPVLEAQASASPVIAIDTPGEREITGGAALLVPQLTALALAEAMRQIAEDEKLRRKLSENGLENVRRFSWQASSLATLEVLSEAARGSAAA